MYLGYAAVVAVSILAVSGSLVQDAAFINGHLSRSMTPWGYAVMIALLPVIVITMILLVQKLQASVNKDEINTLKYMIAGLGIVAVWYSINSNVPVLSGLPTDHLGTLVNAVIIGFTISRFKLLDFGLLARKFLAYSIMLIIAIVSYIAIVLLEVNLRDILSIHAILITTIMLSTLFMVLYRPLFEIIQRQVDHLFHENDAIYNKLLAEFSARTSNILELDKVSAELLATLSKVMHLSFADLLFPDASTGDYISYTSYPQMKGPVQGSLRFSRNGTIAVWLAKEGKTFDVTALSQNPELKSILDIEKSDLLDPRLSLLVPIISHNKLIGILAIGKRQGNESFREQEKNLIVALSRQAGIVIENAQLFALAKERANIDELTGLFNHRYFHQRIDEEIARSSRFGEVFSLLMIDLDFFKSYNDVHGHLYGDKILRRVGDLIKKSIRNVDIAFRYGGDEFAVLLPQTSNEGAMKLAERIRKLIEDDGGKDDTLITCSLGLASWPTEGVMREEIITSADNALYAAKEAGRNRVSAATQFSVTDSHEKSAENSSTMVLSTIYALAATVDAKDHYTYGHSKKVSKYATDIAVAMGFSAEKVNTIRTAGLLHDIGKIGVSDKILSKTDSLSKEEWEPIHAHPTMGVSIIRHVESIKDCLAAVQYHHERYDGQGYPSGLKGNNIPLDARILAVADSYDAMTSARPYRNPMTPGEAMSEIIHCSGTQFDPEIVKIFARVVSLLPIPESVR